MQQYIKLSEKISKYYNYDTGTFENKDDILKRLLLARKRIIHKAFNKLQIFRDIIQKQYEENGNLKYTLVYVPEGNRPDYLPGNDDFDKTDEIADDSDAEHLINQFTLAVAEIDEKITVRKFVSGQSDRENILVDFAEGRVQVLTSMKCLDEGVDVPRSELAIFCASTGNPRQFIQRRGRILRTHKDKYQAVIHDLAVIPDIDPSMESYNVERNLLAGELKRVNNFALLSENSADTLKVLDPILEYYNLSLFNN